MLNLDRTIDEVKLQRGGKNFNFTFSAVSTSAWFKILEHPAEFALKKNNLLKTIPRLAVEWVVEFSFKATSWGVGQKEWTNIFHMTTGEDYGKYGCRTPSVAYHPRWGLQVTSAVTIDDINEHNFGVNFPEPSLGKWIKIRVSQELLN